MRKAIFAVALMSLVGSASAMTLSERNEVIKLSEQSRESLALGNSYLDAKKYKQAEFYIKKSMAESNKACEILKSDKKVYDSANCLKVQSDWIANK
jgi:hypothetical protein